MHGWQLPVQCISPVHPPPPQATALQLLLPMFPSMFRQAPRKPPRLCSMPWAAFPTPPPAGAASFSRSLYLTLVFTEGSEALHPFHLQPPPGFWRSLWRHEACQGKAREEGALRHGGRGSQVGPGWLLDAGATYSRTSKEEEQRRGLPSKLRKGWAGEGEGEGEVSSSHGEGVNIAKKAWSNL